MPDERDPLAHLARDREAVDAYSVPSSSRRRRAERAFIAARIRRLKVSPPVR